MNPYEFLVRFSYRDIAEASNDLSARAAASMRARSYDADDVVHYARVIVAAWCPESATITITLMPYGRSIYSETVTVRYDCASSLVRNVMGHIEASTGPRVSDSVARMEIGRLAEWAESVELIHGLDDTRQDPLF